MNHRLVAGMLVSALLLLGASVTPAAPPAPEGDFHVAPTGKDSNAGTEAAPFATPARAREAVRAKIAKGLQASVTVLLRGGTYQLTEPVIFGPEDSGSEKHAITYTAHPGEKVVLSGARRITGWKRREGNLWAAPLPEAKAGKGIFRELFADGQRLPRARFPNGQELLRLQKVSGDVKTLELDKPLPAGDLGGKDAELVVIQNWSISRAVIVSSTERGVTTATPVGWIGHPWTTAGPGKPAFLEHARAFLDQPGEWYLDRAAGELLYMAAAGEDPAKRTFVAPVTEQLLVMAGRPDAPVRNIKWNGIEFAHTAWRLPAGGYSGIQAGHYGPKEGQPVYVLPSAVEFFWAEDCALVGCRITHTGASGIGFGAGCRRNTVEACEVADVGGNGIVVGWRGNKAGGGVMKALDGDWPAPAETPVGNVIRNSYLHGCGAVNYGCVGLFVAFSADTKVLHNRITDMPYTGVSVGFRWNTTETSQRGCIVEGNHIYDVMKVLADGGGIYTLGLQPGTVLRGNLIHDVHRSAFAHGGAPNNGIFFDEGSKGFLVEGNVIYKTSGEPIRFNQCQQGWHTWKDNTFGKEPPPDAIKSLRAGPAAVE